MRRAPAWLVKLVRKGGTSTTVGKLPQLPAARPSGRKVDTKYHRSKAQLPEIIPNGQREVTLLGYANAIRARGKTKKQIRIALKRGDLAHCRPPLQIEDAAAAARFFDAAVANAGKKPRGHA